MVEVIDVELDRLVATLRQAGNWHCNKAAAAITTLRARIAELEADRAEWVEVERLRMGKVSPAQTPPQE